MALPEGYKKNEMNNKIVFAGTFYVGLLKIVFKEINTKHCIGNNQPENLLEFVDILQQELIRAGVLPEDYDFDAHKELVPMQPGDVPVTYADTSALEADFGFKPDTSLREGLRKFAEWYKEFYM